MKERPILFSAPMVRAILDGRKTQTRRVGKAVRHPDLGNLYDIGALVLEHEPQHVIERACPYGQPGDRLWVREAFQPLFADGVENHWETDWKTGNGYAISYPATDGIQEFVDADDNISSACKPSIHMPRWASRILLEITAVRVERLWDISEADAMTEGIYSKVSGGIATLSTDQREHILLGLPGEHRMVYRELWESINGTGSWKSNPWVWVVEFKRLKGGAK